MTDKKALLKQIDAELSGIPAQRTAEVAGHKYTFHLLNRSEESLSKSLAPDTFTMAQLLSDNSAQTLAVALDKIDDTDIHELFDDVPSTYTAEERQEVTANPRAKERMVRENVMNWILDKPGVFAQTLWLEYVGFKGEAKEAMDQLDPLSTRTPGSDSSPTS